MEDKDEKRQEEEKSTKNENDIVIKYHRSSENDGHSLHPNKGSSLQPTLADHTHLNRKVKGSDSIDQEHSFGLQDGHRYLSKTYGSEKPVLANPWKDDAHIPFTEADIASQAKEEKSDDRFTKDTNDNSDKISDSKESTRK
jgi:hypothetical protein